LNTHFKFAALSASLVLASACAVQYPIPSAQLQIKNIVELPEELSETSGLFCETDGMYSLNDSGSVSDPSKRIMATERETTGNSKSPNKSSALSTPKTGPTKIPTINNGKIAGSLTL